MLICNLEPTRNYLVLDERLAPLEAAMTGAEIVAMMARFYAGDWRDDPSVAACGGDPMRDETDFNIIERAAETGRGF